MTIDIPTIIRQVLTHDDSSWLLKLKTIPMRVISSIKMNNVKEDMGRIKNTGIKKLKMATM